MGSSTKLEGLGLGEYGQFFSLGGTGEKAESTCTDAGKDLVVGVGNRGDCSSECFCFYQESTS